MSRALVCMLLAFWLAAAPVVQAQPAVLGVVVQATRAQLGTGAASPGTSVFDGDRLTTESEGALRIRAGSALLYLAAQSGVTLRQTPGGPQAILNTGTLIVSTSLAGAIHIAAEGAILRAAANAPTVAQVRLLGPKEIHVIARRGALEFTFNGESEIIPEGASYRVVLDPPENMPTGQEPPVRTRKSGRYHIGFFFIIFGGVGWLTEWAIHEALESPDRP
jgi:hypothetical protein